MSFSLRFLPAVGLALVLSTAFPASSWAAPRVFGGTTARSSALFQKAGLLGLGASSMRTQVFPPSKKALSAPKDAYNAQSTGKVKAQQVSRVLFNFSGYTSDQQSKLRDFVTTYYNTLVTVWGDPSPEQQGRTVQVAGNQGFNGVYQPPAAGNASGGTIYFQYDNAATLAVNRFNFARLLLLSFWGARIPSYNYNEALFVEPWVYGMSDAAALLIAYRVAGSPAKFNPADYAFDFLPVYDLLNRPELGNAFIYSPPNADGTNPSNDSFISDFRLPMAQAAFTKIAVENPNFFKIFNQNLYSAGSPRVAVSPNQLKSFAAAAVPTVEGLGFNDWVRRQYVLDCTVTTGPKLYAAVVPDPSTTGDPRPGFVYYVESFNTNESGQSLTYSGTGYGSIKAYDAQGTDVTSASGELRTSNVLNFVNTSYAGEASAGIGFDSLASGAQQRMTLKFRLGSAEATAYFPYGVVGSRTSASSYYGVTLGANSGTVALQSNSGSQSVPLTLGAFAATQTYASGQQVQTTITVNGATFKRNTAWLVPGTDVRSVAFVLEAPSANGGNTFNVTAPGGADKLRMVSFPFYPTLSDEAQVLGVSPDELKMARYRPNLAPALRSGDNLVFGIDGDRHEIYPYISQPIAPGRGYWLETGTGGLSKQVQGEEPSSSEPFEVPLFAGWNQFGVPFNSSFSAGAIKVRYGGFAPVSLDVAEQRGWVAPGIWRWLPGGGYERADGPESSDLAAYEGYYIYVGPVTGVSLVFEPGATTAQAMSRDGWSVPLLVSSSSGRDINSRFGASSETSIAKPPTATRRVSLRFEDVPGDSTTASAGAASAGAGYAEAYFSQVTEGTVWSAIVDGTNKKERVTLSWGNLSDVPSNLQITLRDLTAKKNQILVSGGHYAFTSTGKARRFTLTVKAKTPAKSGKSKSAASIGAS